ncbi:hypothetical protein Tco_1471664, partial [Tanacetum coccineum]
MMNSQMLKNFMKLVTSKKQTLFYKAYHKISINLVNHHEEAKHIWDRVKLLIEGSEISLKERESKLYDEFEMFTSMPGETIHLYYLRQHEAHADEMRIMKERFPNPLALLANTYNSSPSYSNQTQYQQQLSPFASPQQVSPLASQQCMMYLWFIINPTKLL